MNLSRAEVHGVITYYHHFRSTPPGKHVIQVCRAEACQSLVAVKRCGRLAAKLVGLQWPHETSANGMYSLEPVYCLGLCASSPAMQINDKIACHA
jgi:formate dehydrogenase subunit gamma